MQSQSLRHRYPIRLPGGLENAIKQSDERRFEKLDIVDTDCHQVEPFKIMAKYVKGPLQNVFLSPDPEEDPMQKNLYTHYAGKFREPSNYLKGIKATSRPETKGAEWYSAELMVDLFTKLMYDIGIKASIVLPSPTLFYSSSKPDVETTVANAYIDYMLDNILGKYTEIHTLAYVPTNAPENGADLIDRVGKEKGVAGLIVSSNAPTLAGSDAWDPIYEAAQKKGLSITFHANRDLEHPFYKGFEFVGAHALSFPFSLIRQLTSIVLSGVPVRFPELNFVFEEGGVTWIPWLYNRLDDEYVKRRIEAPLLEKLPSEYIKKFYYSSQPLEQSHMETLEAIFEMLDFENHLVYASDYPHWDFDVPSVIYDLPFLSETAKKKILGGNARKVFKLNN